MNLRIACLAVATTVLVAVAGCASCGGEPAPAVLQGSWAAKRAPVILHFREGLQTDLCVPVLGVPLHLATATMERDALDRYHLRVTTIDSALNQELPASLSGSLTPAQKAVTRVMSTTTHALRFCDVTGDTMSCESLIGGGLDEWTRIRGCQDGGTSCSDPTRLRRVEELLADAGLGQFGEALEGLLGEFGDSCAASNQCSLPATEAGVRLDECIVDEVRLRLAGDAGRVGELPICELISTFPDEVDLCVARFKLPREASALVDAGVLDETCEKVETLLQLDVVDDICRTGEARSDLEKLAGKICGEVRGILDRANLDAGLLDATTLRRTCGLRSQVTDFVRSCCEAQATENLTRDAGTATSTPSCAGCDAGCCSDGGVCQPPSFATCTGTGGACVACSTTTADNCGATGCRCGTAPACSGTCVLGTCL